MEEEVKWHWGEGLKYAVEAVKTLFILNGAAAVSILTFIGNTKSQSLWLVFAMASFALGAAAAVVTQGLAYFTQLHYGNAALESVSRQEKWARAVRLHNLAYAAASVGLVLFLAGIGFAGYALWPASK